MNMRNNKIIHTCENLKAKTGFEVRILDYGRKGEQGKLEVILNGLKLRFNVEFRSEVRIHQLGNIIEKATGDAPFLLIADNLFPQVKELLRKEKVNYLDNTGNFFLQAQGQYIYVEAGGRRTQVKEKTTRAFTSAGLRVLYLFLMDESHVNRPQRVIAKEAGVAAGNINYVFQGLKDEHYLLQKNNKEYLLKNKRQLLDKWISGWHEKLSPSLQLGRFRFLKKEDYHNWKNMALKQNETYWGGENAGAIMTDYLIPEVYTLFTSEPLTEFMKRYRLIPDPEGDIFVFEKFWNNTDTFSPTVVHPLLAYASLLQNSDRRSRDTAQRIYDELLHHRF